MTYRMFAAAIAACAMLSACTEKPEATIEKGCVRLELFSDIDANADAKKSCTCLAGKLKDTMSEKDLKALAKTFKDSKTEDDFEENAKENGLSDMAAMNMLGAAKNCALQ